MDMRRRRERRAEKIRWKKNVLCRQYLLAAFAGLLAFSAGYYGADRMWGAYPVSDVIDGDTFRVGNGLRVRLLGIDTPECYYSGKLLRDSRRSGMDPAEIQLRGRAAAEYARELLAGRRVRLKFDVERWDRYGRLLAYVYLPDGTFVNAKLVAEGYARTYTFAPNLKYAELFRQLERTAKAGRRGVWRREGAGDRSVGDEGR